MIPFKRINSFEAEGYHKYIFCGLLPTINYCVLIIM